jgi:methylated-DNA-protein-cysteine methyltransferase-like protein
LVTDLPQPQLFYEQVWRLVRQIPRGLVATYGQIAGLLTIPPGVTAQEYKTYGARWVGSALAACPADVPWQRVINAQGKISLRPGAQEQRRLLEEEAVPFVKDRIPLQMVQWHGPGRGEQPRQARLL